MESTQHTITFQIYYKTTVGEDLYISGNIPELGKWKTLIPMKWTTGHIWTLTLPITPPQFNFKYVYKYQANTIWETGIDRTVDLTECTAHEIKVKSTWNHIKITFYLYNPPYQPDKMQMRINGKIPELGAWEKEIIDMAISKKQYYFNGAYHNMWKKTILCSMDNFPTKFDYKYTAKDIVRKIIIWEREPSRQFELCTSSNTTAPDKFHISKIRKFDANFVTDLSYHKIGDTGIYIGPYPQSLDDIDLLIEQGISAVICAQTDIDINHRQIDWTNMKQYYSSKKIRLEHYPIHDFNHANLVERLQGGAEVLNQLISEGRTVYIHCTAGMGRAPAIAVMYLCLYKKMKPTEAYDYVHSFRECAVPNIVAIKQAYKNAMGIDDSEEEEAEEESKEESKVDNS